VGNVAPDFGVPDKDNVKIFTPTKNITHWHTDGEIDAEGFKSKYIQKNGTESPFYLGYYLHLLTDIAFAKYYRKVTEDISTDVDLKRKVTQDYINQDFIFLKNNPNSVFYTMFSKIKKFDNNYLDFFSEDAFTQRIQHTTNYYLAERTHATSEISAKYKVDLDLFVNDITKFLHETFNT